jgi:ArsR family transcriptional regulator, arsenate/arsenite/antimonite-responsive transcriptional repressor
MRTTMPTNDMLVQRFQAIAEPTRLRIVQLLTAGERCVCELQADLGAGQSRLSFHLKKLKDAGLVRDRRDGRWVYYALAPEALEDMRGFLGDVHAADAAAWREAARGPSCCG